MSQGTSPVITLADIRIPKSLQEIAQADLLYQEGISVVFTAGPGVVVKLRGYQFDLSEEVACTAFAHAHGLPVPRVHCQSPPSTGEKDNFFVMDKVPGVPLRDVIDGMNDGQLAHVAAQLRSIIDKMRSIKSPHGTFGSVTGGPYNNSYFPPHIASARALPNIEAFINEFRRYLLYLGTPQWTKDILTGIALKSSAAVFTHGDLIPCNILVQGSTITAIIDWETGGFYPDYWEYCIMHKTTAMSPNWQRVLDLVFSDCIDTEAIRSVLGALTIFHYQL